MTLYTIALFVHIVGAIGTFIGVSIWLFVAVALRRTHEVTQVRALSSLVQPSGVLAIVSILLLGVAGFYMALTAWTAQLTWIIVATVSFLLLAPFGALVIDPRLRALAMMAAAEPDGALTAALSARTRNPLVGIGLSVYLGVLLGIVFVMTNKPPLDIAIEAMVISTVVGLVGGALLWWVARRSTGAYKDAASPRTTGEARVRMKGRRR